MDNKQKAPGEGRTLAEMKAALLAAGKVTEESLSKARAELANDPEWQAYLAQQPTTVAEPSAH